MLTTSGAFVPQEMKSCILKFFSYEDCNPTGTLSNPFFEGEQYFANLTQMIFLMEELQNGLNYPQESLKCRHFLQEEGRRDRPWQKPAPADAEVIASCKVSLLFRMNASWQGNLVWLDRGAEAQFRSGLELVVLLDDLLKNSQ